MPADHALGGQEHQRARGGGAAQLGDRHAFGDQPFEQHQAVRTLLALEPVEQSLPREVDLR